MHMNVTARRANRFFLFYFHLNNSNALLSMLLGVLLGHVLHGTVAKSECKPKREQFIKSMFP